MTTKNTDNVDFSTADPRGVFLENLLQEFEDSIIEIFHRIIEPLTAAALIQDRPGYQEHYTEIAYKGLHTYLNNAPQNYFGRTKKNCVDMRQEMALAVEPLSLIHKKYAAELCAIKIAEWCSADRLSTEVSGAEDAAHIIELSEIYVRTAQAYLANFVKMKNKGMIIDEAVRIARATTAGLGAADVIPFPSSSAKPKPNI